MKNPIRREIELVHIKTKLIYPGVVKLARESLFGAESIFIISNVLHGMSALKEDKEGYESSYFINNYDGEYFNIWKYKTFENFWQQYCNHNRNSKPIFDGFFVRFKKTGLNFKKILI